MRTFIGSYYGFKIYRWTTGKYEAKNLDGVGFATIGPEARQKLINKINKWLEENFNEPAGL